MYSQKCICTPCIICKVFCLFSVFKFSLFFSWCCFAELKVEIEIWKHSMNRVVVASREGAMVKLLLQQKVRSMQELLDEKHAQVK